MTSEQTKNAIGLVGFGVLCLGAGMAWFPAAFIVGGSLLLLFAVVGIIRGN